MYCNHCGEKREGDGRFCIWCGKEFLRYTGATSRLEKDFVEEYKPLEQGIPDVDYRLLVSGYFPYVRSLTPSGLTYSAPNIVITVDAETSRQMKLRRLQSVDRYSIEYWSLLEELGLI